MWHHYECDDLDCAPLRGPEGMTMFIRTGSPKGRLEPKGVRCPHCGRKPKYLGVQDSLPPSSESLKEGNKKEGESLWKKIFRTLWPS